MKFIFFIFFVFIFLGCAANENRPGYKSIALVPVKIIEKENLISNVENMFATDFDLLNSIIFSFHGHEIAAMGYTEVDRKNKSFSVAAISPIGLKLFEMSFSDGKLDTHYVIEHLLKHGDAAKAIGNDIARIYFNIVPKGESEFFINENNYELKENVENGFIKYVYGGTQSLLIKKGFYVKNKLQWEVNYFNYKKINDKILPFGIIFNNKLYKYKLYILTKQIF